MKHTCIITMPRSGSEVLINHLSIGRGLDNAGEFLCNQRNITEAVRVSDTGKFTSQYEVRTPIRDIQQMSVLTVSSLLNKEFNTRMKMLREFPQPLIVKTFTSSTHYRVSPELMLDVMNTFDVIFLVRKDSWKSILSCLLCERLGIYHVYGSNSSQLSEVRYAMANLSFHANETDFLRLLRSHNELGVLVKNNPHLPVVYFEDYADDAITKLNTIFSTTVQPDRLLTHNKFITDHEKPFINIDRLRELYNLYKA